MSLLIRSNNGSYDVRGLILPDQYLLGLQQNKWHPPCDFITCVNCPELFFFLVRILRQASVEATGIKFKWAFCFALLVFFFKCTNCIPFHNSKSYGCSSNRCIVDELWVRYNVYVQWILSTLCRCEMICNEWLNTYSIICHLFCSSEMNRGYRRLLAPLPLAISSWYL